MAGALTAGIYFDADDSDEFEIRTLTDALYRRADWQWAQNSDETVTHSWKPESGFLTYRWEGCCWGLTASGGPGSSTIKVSGIERQFFDYLGRGAPYGSDDGTLAPWALVASLPFAPEIVLPTLDYYINQAKLTEANPYGFKATYNPTYPVKSNDPCGWVSPWHCGLNQGPIILMIENYRTGLLWRWMRDCPHISSGLRRASFSGGWLQIVDSVTQQNPKSTVGSDP